MKAGPSRSFYCPPESSPGESEGKYRSPPAFNRPDHPLGISSQWQAGPGLSKVLEKCLSCGWSTWKDPSRLPPNCG